MKIQWKDVSGFEGLYQVSSHGEVKSIERLKSCKDGSIKHLKSHTLIPSYCNGYARILLSKNGARYNKFIHRLVAAAFIPNPNNLPAVNHKNGKREDASVENLEWCTIKQNNNDSLTLIERRDMFLVGANGIIATNVNTGEQLRFDSMNEAAKFLGEKSAGSISGFFRGDRTHVKGYVFEKYSNCSYSTIQLHKSVIDACQKRIQAIEKGLSKSRFKKTA